MGNTQKAGAGSREPKAEQKCDGCKCVLTVLNHTFIDENGRRVWMCGACWKRLQEASPQRYVEASFAMQYEEQEENVNGQVVTVLKDVLA